VVIAFMVDDESHEVLVLAVTYGGADWAGRAGRRGVYCVAMMTFSRVSLTP
jgi:hypothetical protein